MTEMKFHIISGNYISQSLKEFLPLSLFIAFQKESDPKFIRNEPPWERRESFSQLGGKYFGYRF